MNSIELDEVQWRSPEWVQQFGLRTDNVLEYFSMSPFYDRASNNQVLKMQTNFNEQLMRGGNDLMKELQKMQGIEYRLSVAREPDLWVIQKLDRKSPVEVEALAVYFIIGENIYQSPSVYNVLVSRLLAVSSNLEQALEIAERLPEFSSSGYNYGDKISMENSDKSETKNNGFAQEENTLLERALNITAGLNR